MFVLTAKNRVTKRWEDIEYFNDSKEFYYMIDSVDYTKYSEAMIINENHNCLMYYESKDYTPYFKTLTKSKRK